MRSNRLHEEQGTRELVEQVRAFARPLARTGDLDPLLDRVGDARYVLLGEASRRFPRGCRAQGPGGPSFGTAIAHFPLGQY